MRSTVDIVLLVYWKTSHIKKFCDVYFFWVCQILQRLKLTETEIKIKLEGLVVRYDKPATFDNQIKSD